MYIINIQTRPAFDLLFSKLKLSILFRTYIICLQSCVCLCVIPFTNVELKHLGYLVEKQILQD